MKTRLPRAARRWLAEDPMVNFRVQRRRIDRQRAAEPPPDPFTQIMMAGPMIVLYMVGLVVTKRANPGLKSYDEIDEAGGADGAS